MVNSFPVALLVVFLITGLARSQVSAPNCSDASFAWSFNSLGQGPCLVVAYLAASCNNGSFAITALLPQHSYTGPNGADDGDLCKCNTVAYNLISACDACQGESWISYTDWSSNCTTVSTVGTFPKPIPAGTRVPNWAFIDPGDNFDIAQAQLAGDSPEITGTASIVPSSTRASQSTFTPQASTSTSTPSSSSSSKGGSVTGAIAGGVVGGVIGAGLIAGVVIWFTIRRWRARSAPSAAYIGGKVGDTGQTEVAYPLFVQTPRLYDPSDPSTYPMQVPSPTIRTTNPGNQSASSVTDFQSNRHAYSGLPEI